MPTTIKLPSTHTLEDLLRELREAKGLTRHELADIMGESDSYVSEYENGNRRLDWGDFVHVAMGLYIDPVTILTLYVEVNEGRTRSIPSWVSDL